jgi:hypothetical protein
LHSRADRLVAVDPAIAIQPLTASVAGRFLLCIQRLTASVAVDPSIAYSGMPKAVAPELGDWEQR